MTIKVPGQMGPCYLLTYNREDEHKMLALDAILEKPGAKALITALYRRMEGDTTLDFTTLRELLKGREVHNLLSELHCLMRRREVSDVGDLFGPLRGLTCGPKSVVRGFKGSVQYGTAENQTYHLAMTAIVYAMALESLDPDFFKDKKHMGPDDHEAYVARRQAIQDYVRKLDADTPPTNMPRVSVVE